MAGVHGDDHLAPALRSVFRRPLARHRPVRPATDGVHVDDQPVAVLAVGLEQKALGPHPLLHVEHDPQVASGSVAGSTFGTLALGGPDPREEAIAGTGSGDPLQELRVTQIHHHAVRVAKHEQCVLHGTVDVENDPGVIGRWPCPDVPDVDGGGGNRSRYQACEANREEPHVRHSVGQTT